MIFSISEYQRCWSDCAGWSGPLLCAKPLRQVFLCRGPFECVYLIDAYELLWAKLPLSAALSHINSLLARKFVCFVVIWWLFLNQFFLRILSGTLSECQTVCILIRTDFQWVLIWVQTVSKSYQTTKVAPYMEKVNIHYTYESQHMRFWYFNLSLCWAWKLRCTKYGCRWKLRL